MSRAERPPLTIGALHLHSWIRTGTLHMRLEIEDVGIRNPDADSKFSDEWFLKSQQLSPLPLWFRDDLESRMRRLLPWRPLSWTRRQATGR